MKELNEEGGSEILSKEETEGSSFSWAYSSKSIKIRDEKRRTSITEILLDSRMKKSLFKSS